MMNFKSLVWQETVQVCCALKTPTGLSPVLIIPYFYYFMYEYIKHMDVALYKCDLIPQAIISLTYPTRGMRSDVLVAFLTLAF